MATEDERAKAAASEDRILLPDLGENVEGGTVLKVRVKTGDAVKKDDPLLEVETDKAAVEVPSPRAGVVAEVRVRPGDKVKVGETIVILGRSAPNAAAASPAPAAAPARAAAEPAPAAAPAPVRTASAPAPARDGGAVFAAPSVRRLARELGVDLAAVRPSGLGGRVSQEDVRELGRGGAGAAAFAPAPAPLPDFSKWGEVVREPMSAVRRKTAEHMTACWTAIPHVTLHDKADVTDVESVRLAFKDRTGQSLTVTAILVRVVASALKLFPKLAASVDMARSEIVFKRHYHVGIAVDTERGLLVPVIRDADKKNVRRISEELADLSARARAAKLTLDEMRGGTFTITNLGGLGVRYFTPIVNHPEVAILGVGRATTEPVYEGGVALPRLLLPLSLSFDHRLVDGADGARALRWIAEALEKPLLLALEG